ncbi:MAG: glycoside hydrolase family 97 catalytic domain-containing protein [Rikenellaceae bacterium]
MKKILLVVAMLVATISFVEAKEGVQTLESPNGDFKFEFYQKPLEAGGAELTYSVWYKGNEVVIEGAMGVEIENKLLESALGVPNEQVNFWCENLRLLETETASYTEQSWSPVYGERATIEADYNELTLKFIKGTDKTPGEKDYNRSQCYLFNVEVRAYNQGVAFRYHFPEAVNGLFIHITGERTSFTMPEGTMAYFMPWAQGHHTLRPLEGWGKDESERPLTMELPSGIFVSLTEANMVDYVRGKFKLSECKPSTLQLSMYDCADIITPYDTPWRVIIASESAVGLINKNDIVLNLAEPCQIEDTSWIKPGKVFRSGLKMVEAKAGVDFAEQMGYQYVHLDARWYGNEMTVKSDATTVEPHLELDMKELCDYAKSKGLGIFVYVNQRALIQQLDDILPLYKEWGLSGIKFGFVQIGNQYWSTWMHEAVRKCAKYGLLVDIHDEYRPTGYSRTYPNLMSQEGIAGNEEFPDADHNTTLPFTRMIAGAGDYTFCYFDKRLKNTKGHQLALPVIYYSPLQFMNWYDTPARYSGEKELEFWSAIPTVWDDSRAIDGKIGEFIIQARRSGDEWFVGAIINNDGGSVEIDTSKFLEKGVKYEVSIYEDDPKLDTTTNVRSSVKRVKGGDVLKFNLQPRGGVSLHFTQR